MRSFIIVFILIVLYSVAIVSAGSGIAFNTGELIVQFDDSNANEDFHCQQCYDYELTEDASEGWHYRYAYSGFFELDHDGSECCSLSCVAEAGTCNTHAILDFPPNLSIKQSTTEQYGAIFTGIYDSESGFPSTCQPPGHGDTFCGNFQFTEYIITSAGNVNVSQTSSIPVISQTIRNTVRMDTWPFNAGSKGMRIQLLLTVTNNNALAWRLWPANEPATSPQSGTFTAVSIETKQRIANVTFSTVARLNGSLEGIPVNISGPYTLFDPNSRYFYIDVPPFISMEYDVFTHVDFLSLLGAANTIQISFVLLSILIVFLLILN